MTDPDALLALIDENEAVQVASDLVSIPSITTSEGDGVATFLKRWFDDLAIPTRLYPADAQRANFFADYGAIQGPGRYLVNGHQDVKPVVGMTIEPFNPTLRDGRLYGRGSCDMKGGIAAVLCAFKALVRAGKQPEGGISFFSDIEEEYGGHGGYLWAQREGLLDGYAGFISCEPSGLEIQIGNRGCYVTCFETQGRSAHSGLAHLGVNAVQHMAVFITEFLKLPYLDVENSYFGKPSANFERIAGGLYLSAVPDRCIACLDSRIIPETPPELVQQQVEALMLRLKRDQGITVCEVSEPEDWRPEAHKERAEAIPADHQLTERMAQALVQSTGMEARIGGCPGMTMAGMMIAMGTPAIICGPGALAQAHTEDEWIEVGQILQAARAYTALMAAM